MSRYAQEILQLIFKNIPFRGSTHFYKAKMSTVQNRMVPKFVKMLPKELVTSTGTTPSANGRDDNMDYCFFSNQVAAGGSKVKVRQMISGEDKVGATGTNSPRLSWKCVKWIESLTKLPVVVKGVLSVEDTVESVRAGAAVIVASDQGGRQFDGAPPPVMEVLPAIAAKIDGKIPILVDSRIRTSTDIVKALCLGASGVMLG
jgi:isopentenyl diphosphate isomerase/L-lactate dehydrogenase-like FMN-dependent dehydrogenase